MREFWQRPQRVALFLCQLFALNLFAKFDQTTSPKVDSSKFGGLSEDELTSLEKQKLQNAYLEAIYDRIKKFDKGDESSAIAGSNGRYGGAGEAHIENGDSMISHEGGSNLLEKAVEEGALGKAGLTGQARVDAENKVREGYCKPNTGPEGGCRNTNTGQLQKSSKDISAALYDAGPAHPGKEGADDDHRFYAVKAEVRSKVKAVGDKYAAMIIKDATLDPGKQPNIDLLHKAFSKLEQDKYIMMATDAIAFRSARLSGIDTSIRENKNVIGEYKQLAIDAYAKNAGNIEAAEKEIQEKLAERVAEKKVLNNVSICADGLIHKDNDCSTGNAKTLGKVKYKRADEAAEKILLALNTSQDGIKKTAIINAIKGAYDKPDGSTDGEGPDMKSLMARINLSTLSGVANSEKLNELYSQAKQNLNPEETTKIQQYKDRLTSNKCLSFTSFCYSRGVAGSLDGKTQQEIEAAAKLDLNGSKSRIEKDEFQKISGDPGAYFKDTRELLFNNFAYAYNQPLEKWQSIVTNADFKGSTDKNIKDVKPYQEFVNMYQAAMAQAKNIQENTDKNYRARLKSGGATPEQLAKVKDNYSVNFKASQKTHMELFGQNKARDAIMMDWRKGSNKVMIPSYRRPAAGSGNTSQTGTRPPL